MSIYGIKEEEEYTFKFSTKTISTIPYPTQYIDDSSIEQGKEVVQQKGANGLITETYISKYLNGKLISTDLLSRDTYSAMTRIVKRGTKAVSNPTIQEQTKEPTVQEEQPIIEEQPANPEEETSEEIEEQPAA